VVRPPARVFRPELQGLRALAVTLVVIYHIWLNRVSGGVDVFFAISGFLLTGQLLRAAGNGPLELARRWSRTVVRLVPSMAVVLLATAGAGMVLLPEGRWAQTVRELLAAGLFVENWRLAADSVDYAARSNVPSVVQHFWSLAVQGQFFLVWPLLVAGVVLAARGSLQRIRRYLTVAVAAVFLLSLSYSIELTAADQPLAYFHSLTRLWEFALGGLLALYVASRHATPLPRRVRVGLGWVGVLGLVVCGSVFQASSVFPGLAALWPTGCAVLVLLAGTTGERFAADRILTARPVLYLGELSFTLYLWHWPVLILYRVTERPAAIGPAGLGIVAVSLALAVLTHHLVEKPVLTLRLSTSGSYRLGALCVIAVMVVVSGWQARIVLRTDTSAHVMDADHPGALALVSGEPLAAPVLPPPVSVLEDWVRIERWDCTQLARFPMKRCTLPMDGPPTKRIVVVGDSHLQQLTGALIPTARAQHWQLTVIARGACPFSTVSEVNPDEVDCLNWNSAAEAEIEDLRPDAVVTLASRNVRVGLTEQTPPGFVAQWRRLDALHIPVLAIRDNPRFDTAMPDCVQNFTNCGAPRNELYTVDPPWTRIRDLPSNVSFLDIANAVCTASFCPAEVGNVLVYLDDNHLSASYSTSMAGLLADATVAALSRGAPSR
jgi:peptidoglycan/LPS O-acetylase OafA/YrhL